MLFINYEWIRISVVPKEKLQLDLDIGLTSGVSFGSFHNSLTVMGKNSDQLGRAAHSKDSVSRFHKREISHGPYQVVWPLPSNANKDDISAEFV